MQNIQTVARPPAPPQSAITDTFRAWVRDSLVALDLSALSLGRRLGLGKNTVGDFIATPGRDIRLETAHAITCELRAIAAARGVALPRLRPAWGVRRDG